MPVNNFLGRQIDVNDEGFMTDPSQWDEALAEVLAKNAGIPEMTDAHWKAIRFAHQDLMENGASPTLNRMAKVGGFEIKELFKLFPGKAAKKISYIAGGTKPTACV